MHGQTHYFHPTPLIPRLVRWCYILVFAGLFAAGAYYALVHAPAVIESGSPVPTTSHTVLHHEDGESVYITQRQQITLNLLGAALALSLLAWLMVGILVEVKLKIHIFRGSPAPLPREPKHDNPSSFSMN
jgi:hypothetical protein